MTFIRRLATFAVAIPSLALAQEGPRAQAARPPKALLDTMVINVDRIMPSLEHSRWTANIALWTARLNHPGRLDRAVIAEMRKPFNEMAGIVAQLVGPDEKARWEFNRDLWEYLLGAAGEPSGSALAAMRNLLRRMEANVARIEPFGEKQRWTLNVELWQTELGSRPAATGLR